VTEVDEDVELAVRVSGAVGLSIGGTVVDRFGKTSYSTLEYQPGGRFFMIPGKQSPSSPGPRASVLGPAVNQHISSLPM
jgi:hypothetical protein